jgi:hypothetical protein
LRDASQKYRRLFQREVPDWVLALGVAEAAAITVVACRLQWRIHPEKLVGEED